MNHIIKVAIQGDKASFHEIAAHKYYQEPIELIYCSSFNEVFEMLDAGLVDKAFVAIRNSSHGKIIEVEPLIASRKLHCEGRYLLYIQQHLIGMYGADIKHVKKIVSHSVALSQCDLYLKEHHGNNVIEEYHDTSAAVKLVKDLNDPSIVAIGSEAAAKLYGLNIVRRNVQNDTDNATLFKSFSYSASKIE